MLRSPKHGTDTEINDDEDDEDDDDGDDEIFRS